MCVCRRVIMLMSMCGWVMRVRILTATGGLFPFEVAENHMSGCFAWGLLVPLHDRWLEMCIRDSNDGDDDGTHRA